LPILILAELFSIFPPFTATVLSRLAFSRQHQAFGGRFDSWSELTAAQTVRCAWSSIPTMSFRKQEFKERILSP
jgi:hypothetical protein